MGRKSMESVEREKGEGVGCDVLGFSAGTTDEQSQASEEEQQSSPWAHGIVALTVTARSVSGWVFFDGVGCGATILVGIPVFVAACRSTVGHVCAFTVGVGRLVTVGVRLFARV